MLDFSHPYTIDHWLEIATDRLCDEAKARVRNEIEAHSSDAVETLMSEGRDRAEAGIAAIKSLGNPYDAAKKFKRIHLTAVEAEKLKEEIEKLNKPLDRTGTLKGFLILHACIIGGFIIWKFMLNKPLTTLMFAITLIYINLLSYEALIRPVRKLWPKSIRLKNALINVSLFKLIEMSNVLACFIFNSFREYQRSGDLSRLNGDILFQIILFSIFSVTHAKINTMISIIRKLGRNARISDDFEPPREVGA